MLQDVSDQINVAKPGPILAAPVSAPANFGAVPAPAKTSVVQSRL